MYRVVPRTDSGQVKPDRAGMIKMHSIKLLELIQEYSHSAARPHTEHTEPMQESSKLGLIRICKVHATPVQSDWYSGPILTSHSRE